MTMSEGSETGNGVLVARFEKNKKDEVRLSIDNLGSRKVINIRVFYKDDSGAFKPGKQGIALSVDRYKDLAAAILELGQHLKAEGLI